MCLRLFILKDYGFTVRAEVGGIFRDVKGGVPGRDGLNTALPLRGRGNCPCPGAHSRLQFFPGIRMPGDSSFPHLGQFIQAAPLRKQKSPCLNKETKATSSAVPLFLPGHVRPLKLPGNGGVRRGLVPETGSAPQLRGDLRACSPGRLAPSGGSLGGMERGYCPHLRILSNIP